MATRTQIEKMQVILDVCQLLNTTQDIHILLKTLLDISVDLIEGGDTCSIRLYDPTTNLLEQKVSVGYGDTPLHGGLLPGEGMAGKSFLTQSTQFFRNKQAVLDAEDTLQSKNRIALEQALCTTVYSSGICGAICVPLQYHGECIGVITMCNTQNQAALTDEDVTLLETISAQATIALINAQTQARLRSASQQLQQEKERYQYASELHSRFADMILNGSSPGDIISETAQLLNQSILLLDAFRNTLAHRFDSTFSPEMIDDLATICKTVASTAHATTCTWKHLQMRVQPIIANGQNRGWLCISEKENRSQFEVITIERSLTILALELMKLDLMDAMEQNLKGDFLDALIAGHESPYLNRCAQRYHFDTNRRYYLIAIETSSPSENQLHRPYPPDTERYLNNFGASVDILARKRYTNVFTQCRGNTILLIVAAESTERSRIQVLLQSIWEAHQVHYSEWGTNAGFKAAVSPLIQCLSQFGAAYHNTIQTLHLVKPTQPDPWLFYDDLEVSKLLLNNPKEDLEGFVHRTLGPLLEYKKDPEEYLRTLKMYIQSNGNWSQTKEQLHIHGNTLSYRLNRIMEILSVDLDTYSDRLRVQLALEVRDLLNTSTLLR